MTARVIAKECRSMKPSSGDSHAYYEVTLHVESVTDMPVGTVLDIMKEQIARIDWSTAFLPPLPSTKEELIECLTNFLQEIETGSVYPGKVEEFVEFHYKEKK